MALRKNRDMKPRTDATLDTTPAGRLDEGLMGPIVGYQLAQAAVTTNQVFAAAALGAEVDLRQVEFTILALVDANPDLLATTLARALAVTPPNITMWLDRLGSRGLVERVRSATDRRAQHLRTTPAGAATAARLAQRVAEAEQAALGGLSPGERAMLLELLHKVARCRGRTARSRAAAPAGVPRTGAA